MRTELLGCLWLLAACSLPCLMAEEIDAPIVRVIVFPDRAEIQRQIVQELAAGRSELVIGGLPADLDPRSLRCLPGEGLRVVSLSVEEDQLLRPQREVEDHFLTISTEIKDTIRTHEDGLLGLAERERLLAGYRAHLLQAISTAAAQTQPEVQRWREAIDFIAAQSGELTATRRQLQLEIHALRQRLEEEKTRLRLAMGRSEPVEQRRVRLLVEREQPGPSRLDLRYLVRSGVQWGMRYEVRLDRATQRAQLRALIGVSQTSGEDWDEAELHFSTRQPARGLRAPALPSLVLGVRPQVASAPSLSRHEAGSIDPAPAVIARESAKPIADEQLDAMPAPSAPRAAWNREASPTIRAVSGELDELDYIGQERLRVPADGQIVLVPLGHWETSCTWHYEAVPEQSEIVFIRAALANPVGTRLLAGPAEAHLDGRYLGEVSFPDSPAAARIELPFGEVEHLAVSRHLAPLTRQVQRRGERSLRSFTTDIAIVLTNHGQEAASVLVREAIPTSGTQDVQVRLEPETSPAEDRGEGLLHWQVELPPQDEHRLRLSYTITIDGNR